MCQFSLRDTKRLGMKTKKKMKKIMSALFKELKTEVNSKSYLKLSNLGLDNSEIVENSEERWRTVKTRGFNRLL